ncbi:hypothetical protein [Fastidiosibacter lacustris]|uniref:hypothetical protein n=1 Tax=Fastidiosibacter lacustris TaxID=2056695 RepID=UPI000E342D67|nr:hypothetical protein [Fastidiosibacter lacustris]
MIKSHVKNDEQKNINSGGEILGDVSEKTTPKTLVDLVPYGITVLDAAYVKQLLVHTTWFSRYEVIERYCQVWVDEYHATDCLIKRANLARRKANTWIRQYLNQ